MLPRAMIRRPFRAQTQPPTGPEGPEVQPNGTMTSFESRELSQLRRPAFDPLADPGDLRGLSCAHVDPHHRSAEFDVALGNGKALGQRGAEAPHDRVDGAT